MGVNMNMKLFEEMNKARRKLGLFPIPENMEVVFMGRLDRFLEKIKRKEESKEEEPETWLMREYPYPTYTFEDFDTFWEAVRSLRERAGKNVRERAEKTKKWEIYDEFREWAKNYWIVYAKEEPEHAVVGLLIDASEAPRWISVELMPYIYEEAKNIFWEEPVTIRPYLPFKIFIERKVTSAKHMLF